MGAAKNGGGSIIVRGLRREREDRKRSALKEVATLRLRRKVAWAVARQRHLRGIESLHHDRVRSLAVHDMRDPDIVFMFHDLPTNAEARGMEHLPAAEPVSFRNDYMATCQEVYKYDDAGKRTHAVPRLKRGLKDFCRTWFANLHEQGFLSPEARREILE